MTEPIETATPVGADSHPTLRDTSNEAVSNLASYWQLFLLRGIVVTAFGLFFLFHPRNTVDVLAKVFGSLLIIEGAANLVKIFIVCCCTDSLSMLCVYFLSFAANTTVGILIFTHPNETASLLLIFISIWFILIGILNMLFAGVLGSAQVHGPDVLIGCVGLVYFIFGAIIFSHANEGVAWIVRLIGAVVTLFGIQLFYLGVRLKASVRNPPPEYHSSEYSSIINKQDDEKETVVSESV